MGDFSLGRMEFLLRNSNCGNTGASIYYSFQYYINFLTNTEPLKGTTAVGWTRAGMKIACILFTAPWSIDRNFIVLLSKVININ